MKTILTNGIMKILHAQPDHRIAVSELVSRLKTEYCSDFTEKQLRYARAKLTEKGLLDQKTAPCHTGTKSYVLLTEKALREKGKQTTAATKKQRTAEENSTAEKQPAAIKTTINPPMWVAEAKAADRTEILGQVTLDEVPAKPAQPKLKVNALPPDDEDRMGRLGFKKKWQLPEKLPKANPKNGLVFEMVYDGSTYHVQIPTNPPAWAKYCSKSPITWESDWVPLEKCIVDVS